jgi:phosphoribosylamine--glycine ligase
MEQAVEPTVAALRARGIDYRGVLYAGLMLTPDGPKMLEYNARFGDPETQVVIPRFDGDLTALLAQAASGALTDAPSFVDDAAVTVVCATEGYPRSPRTGDVIEGLSSTGGLPDAEVFFAGVARGDSDGELVTAGGRVLNITGIGASIDEARSRAYACVSRVSWRGMYTRSDIAAAPTEEVQV